MHEYGGGPLYSSLEMVILEILLVGVPILIGSLFLYFT